MNIFFFAAAIIGLAIPSSALAFTYCADTERGCTFEQVPSLIATAQGDIGTEIRIEILNTALGLLKKRLAELLGVANGANTSSGSCLNLTQDLYIGKTDVATNGEVTRLQNLLGMRATGYYGNLTADAVMRWQKARGMDFVTLKSGVGPMTRAKMKCSNAAMPEITKVSWRIEMVNPAADSYYKDEQRIFVDVIRADNSIRGYDLGTGYGCAAQSQWSPESDKSILGFVNCYYALSGVTFTAYMQNGKFIVEKGVESARDGSIQKTVILEL